MNKINKNKPYKKNKNLVSIYLKKSNKKITDARIANSFFSRLMGAMFRKNIEYPLLFEIPQRINKKERSCIHSFFMRFELKLVFIDEKDIIFEIADLKPWKYYAPKKSAKYIMEFDKEKFDDLKLKIGDEIILK